MTRVLVSGASGLLGAAIVREFSNGSQVAAYDRGTLDITNGQAVAGAIAAVRPDVVINCAAFNDVDRAEDEPEAALRVNAFAVRVLARVAHEAGARFVHYSTDFVFDGTADRPYTEADRPNPRGVYAASKLLGEWFALEYPESFVLRVESLFGHPGPQGARKGSLGTIVARIRAGEAVPVFTDRTVSPGYTADIASATRQLLEQGVAPGLYHCVNTGAATWAEIAVEAAAVLGLPLRMTPITLETAALKAPRPRYCALSSQKLEAAGIQMPPWQDALRRFLSEG